MSLPLQDSAKVGGDLLTVALTILAQRGIPSDVQELLVRGDPMRGIQPSALTAAVMAVAHRLSRTPAALSRPSVAEGAVKALEWRYIPDAFPPMWITKTTIGSYHIEEAAGSDSPSFDLFNPMAGPMGNYEGLDEAKAAAQADYESRIRSALVSQPLPAGAESDLVGRLLKQVPVIGRYEQKFKCWPGDNDFADSAALLKESATTIAQLQQRIAEVERERDAAENGKDYVRKVWKARAEAAERERDALVSYIDPGGDPVLVSRIIMNSIENEVRAEAAEAKLAEAVEEMKALDQAYVNLLESGRDRIIFFGGTCDPVDVMEGKDPALRRARSFKASMEKTAQPQEPSHD